VPLFVFAACVNSYKSSVGNQACTPCDVHKVAVAGSTAVSACRCDKGALPSHDFVSWWSTKANWRVGVVQGWTGPDGATACTICPGGYYKNVTGPTREACCPFFLP
jgi:hypothetical protein